MKKISDILQIDKILANMRFEINVSLRGWFFRIFAGIVLLLFITLDIILFTNAIDIPRPRAIYGISSFSPYSIVLFLNLFQTTALIFLAGDLFSRYKKYNTMEVVFIRSMSNAALVIGRSAGILLLFISLDILLLVITAVIQIVFGRVDFSIVPWLLYFILIIIPSMIFIVGLTFIMIRFVKNQAVVILSLLGYAALIIFYLKENGHFIYDFSAMYLPLVYSDFTGIADLSLILLQRGSYLFAGLFFIIITILFFPRLPQSNLLKKILFVLIFFFIAGMVITAQNYISFFNHKRDLRNEMISLNGELQNKANIEIDKCRINLKHTADKISVISQIVYRNPNDSAVNQFYLTLNPGLIVSSVKQNNSAVKFERQAHIVKVFPEKALPASARDSIVIEYEGTIDEAAAYLDIPEDEIGKKFNIWYYQILKKYAFVTKDYLLLSPENMWYPAAVLPADINHLIPDNKSFIKFRLKVTADSSLTVISQGKKIKTKKGSVVFRPETLLPALSLIIGKYEQRSVQVDSVNYSLYVLPEHTYFDEYFTKIGDTIGAVIKETVDDYEGRLGLTYPFKRFSLIEVPIQFYSYSRARTVAVEITQPEQIWLSENGTLVADASFSASKFFMSRRQKWNSQTITDKENQIALLRSFINNTFFGGFSFLQRLSENFFDYRPQYSPFPNYYCFSNYVSSLKYPVFNTSFEAYLQKRVENNMMKGGFIRFTSGSSLTAEEETNLLLSKKNLKNIIGDKSEIEKLPTVIKIKGAYLFNMFEKEFNIEDFPGRINRFIERNRFRATHIDSFYSAFNSVNGKQAENLIKEWYQSRRLPGYEITQVDMFKTLDRDRVRYQVLFNVENPEAVDGLISVSFQYRGFFRRMMSGQTNDEEPPRLYKIPAGRKMQIGIVPDNEPQAIIINTLISKNLPQMRSIYFEKAEDKNRFTPFEGKRIIEKRSIRKGNVIIIADNTDSTFQVRNLSYQSVLKKWILGKKSNNENEYRNFRFWDLPNRWTLFKNGKLYGKYINSAYYIKAGDGRKKAVWKADISKAGLYDVYCYSIDYSSLMEGRRRRHSRNDHGGAIQDFNYTVYSDAGADHVTVDMGNTYLDWTLLGSYYFSEGTARVELSDKSKGEVVVADAVKWVKK